MFTDIQAVVLDRDGVINADSEHFIKTPEEWIPLPGSIEAIGRLSRAGLRIAICSNQSGIARGLITAHSFSAITRKLFAALDVVSGKVELVRYCPHSPDSACICRKPLPGMLQDICRYLALAPHAVLMVGDSIRDIECALSAGCAAALLRTGHGETAQGSLSGRIPTFDDLQDLVDFLIAIQSARRFTHPD